MKKLCKRPKSKKVVSAAVILSVLVFALLTIHCNWNQYYSNTLKGISVNCYSGLICVHGGGMNTGICSATLLWMGNVALITGFISLQEHLPGINMDTRESKHTLSDIMKHLCVASQLHLTLSKESNLVFSFSPLPLFLTHTLSCFGSLSYFGMVFKWFSLSSRIRSLESLKNRRHINQNLIYSINCYNIINIII